MTSFNDMSLEELEDKANEISERLQSPGADLETEELLGEALPVTLGLLALAAHHRECTRELEVERERLKLVRGGQSAIGRLIVWAGEKAGRSFTVSNRVEDGWHVDVRVEHSAESSAVDDAAQHALEKAAE